MTDTFYYEVVPCQPHVKHAYQVHLKQLICHMSMCHFRSVCLIRPTNVITDVHPQVVTRMRVMGWETKPFLISINFIKNGH